MKRIIKTITTMALLLGIITAPAIVIPLTAAAQTPQAELCKGSGGTWNGSACTNTTGTGGTTLEGFIKNIVNVLLFVIGAVAVIMIIIGGIRYTVSNGDQSAVTGAKNTILYAVVGLVVSILAYSIVNFVITNIN